MSRLLLAAAVAAILFLVGAFVPVGGKTLIERWNGSPSSASRANPKGASPARSAQGPAGTAQKRPPEPVEHHTEDDRSAIDRIVTEHAADPPAPRR
jgi:hypothetical protein